MSERLHEHVEQSVEAIDTSQEREHSAEKLRERAEASPEISKRTVEHLKHKAAHEAVSGKEITVGEQQESSQPQTITRELKNQSYRKTIRRVQGQLSKPDRALSRIIHQPTVEKLSNVGAQTVARSSGILGGGVFAFLGSVALLVLAKRYGFRYNYLVFLLLFVLGFGVGLLVELLVRLATPKKR